MLKILLIYLSLFSISTFASDSALEVIPLFNRPASELQPLIYPLLEGSEHVIANGSTLIVKATPSRLVEIKELVKQLDSRLHNLSITVIQSRTRTAHELNAAAKIRINVPIDHPSQVSGRIHGHISNTDDLDRNDSTQIIRTLEGRPAYIKTGQVHPVHNTYIYDSGYGYSTISRNIEFIDVSTGFLVTPRLTGNQVTMDVTPWSDEQNNRGTIDTQGASTTIRVNLGEWVEIGGISEQSQMIGNGILSHHNSTENTNMHILIKVDKM